MLREASPCGHLVVDSRGKPLEDLTLLRPDTKLPAVTLREYDSVADDYECQCYALTKEYRTDRKLSQRVKEKTRSKKKRRTEERQKHDKMRLMRFGLFHSQRECLQDLQLF